MVNTYRKPWLNQVFRKPLFLTLLISIVLVASWLFSTPWQISSGAFSRLESTYSSAVSSDWYWLSGIFVSHELGSIPRVILHHTPTSKQELGYSAVVVYLISETRLRKTILSLSYLFRNVPMHPWPIVLFYSEDMDDMNNRLEFLLHLYDHLGSTQKAKDFVERIEYVKLNWSLPPGFPTDKDVVKPVFAKVWPGYHKMCAFYATQIFDHPRLQNVTYYMRLDTDSFIYKPVCHDPFDTFHSHNRSYGYRSLNYDPPFVTVGMWDLTDQYARSHPEVAEQLEENGWQWPRGRGSPDANMGKTRYPGYYNNFEIVKLEAFRRPEVKAWFEEITKVPERFYKYRWSDASIRHTTVNMFFDIKREVEQYCSIPYYHNGQEGGHCTCDEQKEGRHGEPAKID